MLPLMALLGLGTACGASIQAVYEGDVRFEHCMALDSRQEVKPTIRSACWEEWTKFYTFGQTLDRIEYAKKRTKQLQASSDFDEGDVVSESRAKSAVPDPTSVLAPPPMTLATDGGTSPADAGAPGLDASADSATSLSLPPGASCIDACESSWAACQKECGITSCQRACDTKHKRCIQRCL